VVEAKATKRDATPSFIEHCPIDEVKRIDKYASILKPPPNFIYFPSYVDPIVSNFPLIRSTRNTKIIQM